MRLFGRRTTQQSVPETPSEKKITVSPKRVAQATFVGLQKTRRVILRPLVSEKTAHLAGLGKYAFEVAKSATRVDVKREVKALYGIRPVQVNIQNYRGNHVRFGRTQGLQNSWKKAIVTLPSGQKIDVHEGV